MRLIVAAVLALATLLSACGGDAPPEVMETNWEPWTGRRPGEHQMAPDQATAVWAGQVVDEETGVPVPDCRVRVFSGVGKVVLGGEGTLLGEEVTDQDGFVVMGVWMDPEPTHFLFEAEGYAPRTEFKLWDPRDAVQGLARGKPFRGRVVDPLGRACPGVRVSTFEGCPHAPATRRTVTDREGRFSFDGVDVENLWIEGPGIASTYGHWYSDGERGALVLAEFGVTATGRVLSREGKPLPGVWVRSCRPRGPGVRTDVEGRFELDGLEANCALGLSTDSLPESNGVIDSTGAATLLWNPRPLTLFFDLEDAFVPREYHLHRVTLELPGGPGLNRVALLHLETGKTYVTQFEGDGEPVVTMKVLAGPYEVRVGGPFLSRWLAPFTDEFTTSGPLLEPKPYAARERASLRIVLTGLLPEEDRELFAVLRDAQGHQLEVGRQIRTGEEILVPVDAPLALLVSSNWRAPTILEMAPVPAGTAETVVRVLAVPTPTRLGFRLTNDLAVEELTLRFLDADLRNLWSGMVIRKAGRGNVEVACHDSTFRALLIENDEADTFALLEIPEKLPEGEVHDFGEVTLELVREIRVTVLDDRERPQDGLAVTFPGADEGFYPELETAAEGEGAYRIVRNRPVRRILITAEDHWTHYREVDGWGPFRIVLPSSSVTVALPEGDLDEAWGYLDGRPLHLDEETGTLRIRGVPPGLHRLKVCDPDGRRRQRLIRVGEAEDLKR